MSKEFLITALLTIVRKLELSQRDHEMIHIIKYFAKSLKVT